MKIVTLTSQSSVRFGDEKALQLIKQAGFDGYDYSFFTKKSTEILWSDGYREYFENLRKFADGIGLPCLQTHSPSEYSLLDEKQAEEYVKITLRSIEATEILGAKIVVVHPEKWFSAEQNKAFYDKVLPAAKKAGVIIATENMFRWKDEKCEVTAPGACGTAEDFVRHIDLMNDPSFKGCLDIGHSQMVNCEGAVALIKALGKERICALHVHDNDLYHDDHVFPFIGKSDWKEICKALKDIGYDGHFTFEADATLKNYPSELIGDCLKLLAATGRYLVKLIEGKEV
ncbi:MAG: sugar phosphate isomerase/epimerase [Clostridia bacterium]|nr:sugar phosphate isomerase/epimerase [Clostridia bacterium]